MFNSANPVQRKDLKHLYKTSHKFHRQACNEIKNNIYKFSSKKRLLTASQLIHYLIEENHSDNQEAKNPPIGACKVSDTDLFMIFCNVDNFKTYEANQDL